MNARTNKPPVTFWIIVVIALLWNLVGLFQFITQAFYTEQVAASLPEADRELLLNTPIWVLMAYGLAVISGTLGCIGLLLGRKWARTLFIISLIGVVIQMGYNFVTVLTNEELETSSLSLAVFVLIIAMFLVWYSRKAITKGWIR